MNLWIGRSPNRLNDRNQAEEMQELADVREGQKAAYDGRIIGTELTQRADFATLAEAFQATRSSPGSTQIVPLIHQTPR